MHLSLAGSAVLMLLLLFALGVQSGQITRDADNGQLKANRRNLQSLWKKESSSLVLCRSPCSAVRFCPPTCSYCEGTPQICRRSSSTG
nr:TPA_inf: conotoxin precursor P [Conus ebraeus]